ncbi:sensor histidine kinase [Dactylosporangium sp. NPDC000244]|uniref:sensor histidine kinase n=1 Tax=Dactylosporangium sp. NPDC000244 TaxID=3154365 RepID=UPI003326103A
MTAGNRLVDKASVVRGLERVTAWNRLVDAALVAGGGILLAAAALALAASWGGASWAPGLAAGAAVIVAALLRRRAPLASAGAGLAVAVAAVVVARVAGLPVEPQPGLALGLAVLAGDAVRRFEPRVAAGIAGGALLVLAAGPLLSARASSGGATVVAVADVLVWVAGVGGGLWLRLAGRRRQELAEGVRREERLALARELHDVVAHHVTGIVVQAQAARVVAGRHPERLEGSIAGIEEAGSEALAAMRRIVSLLRDTGDAAPASGETERLEALVRRFEDGDTRSVRLRLPDTVSAWPPELTSTVYRIVQESLTNVARHAAQAATVDVSVVQSPAGVTVSVTDDAPPPARAGLGPRAGGFGLIGMRERVEALGGSLEAGPRSPLGWAVTASLPPLGASRDAGEVRR